MADVSFVKLIIAKLAMQYASLGGDACSDEDLGAWTRRWIYALVDNDPAAHEFAADLLGEAEGFRRADVERKRRAREEREAAAKKGARHASKDSAESLESTERDHRQDHTDHTLRGIQGDSVESKESLETELLPPEEPQAGGKGIPPTSQGTRPKSKTPQTPKTEKAEKNIIPPTLEMVARYCENRKNGIDPAEFIAHYAKTDWKLKNGRVTNWQACVFTWEKIRAENRRPRARTGDSIPVGPLV